MAEEVQTAEDPLPPSPAEAEAPEQAPGVDWKKLALFGAGLLAAGVVGLAVNEYLMRRFAAARAARNMAEAEAHSRPAQSTPPSQPPPPPEETGETGTRPAHLAAHPSIGDDEDPGNYPELEEDADERLGG